MQIWTENPCESLHHGQAIWKIDRFCFLLFLLCSAPRQLSPWCPTWGRGNNFPSDLQLFSGCSRWRRISFHLPTTDKVLICFSFIFFSPHKLLKLHLIFDLALISLSLPTKLSKLNFVRIWPQTKVDAALCLLFWFLAFS